MPAKPDPTPIDVLGLFAKYWEPGQVKSRLAARLGARAASELYRCFLETLVVRFATVANFRRLVFAPPERSAEFTDLAGPEWPLTPQVGGDLGTRMERFFSTCFITGNERVVLIGSDSPTLPESSVQQAFQALQEFDVVLGPAEDGGYYLVGLRKPVPEMFQDVTWSSPQVLTQTLSRLADCGVRCHLLPPWYDIDELEDLQRLAAELQQRLEPEYQALRRAVAQALTLSDRPGAAGALA